MANVKIQALDKGPLLVTGDVDVIDGDGNILQKPDRVALCRCGMAKNMPFCDSAYQDKSHSNLKSK